MGEAMNTDEYAPAISPTRSARPNSSSVTAPSTPAPISRMDSTGRTAESVVLIERMNVWFSERFIMSV